MAEPNKFYVTTPIYYGTAKPHLGSLYSTLLADVIARWQKISGKKTFFLTGTDEHGQKVAQAAEKAGKDPKSFVDSFVDSYKHMWRDYEFAYDKFIRTTDPEHKKAVQEWVKTALKKGDIYKSIYSGWYCTPDETFVVESSDATEKAPLCTSCNRETVFVSEESYFFRLSAYQDRLLQLYQENPHFIVPQERMNEVIRFVQSGLKDLSISRTTISWGIPFPDDHHHVVYVWVDALINYISAIGYGEPPRSEEFNTWWPADLHILGKDIVRFHAVFWPAMLMAAGLPLPKQLLVHGWIKVNQQKMSKSLGNVIDPEVLLKHYGVDPVRYYLMRHIAITHDSEFNTADLERHIESDLANDLGNLLNRMLTLAFKYDLSEVPSYHAWAEESLALREACWSVIEDVEKHMNEYMFHMALSRIWKYINQVNSYFHAHEPWKLAKTDRSGFTEIISAVCHSLHNIGVLLWPIMPKKMEELLKNIGIIFDLQKNSLESLKTNRWESAFYLQITQTLFEKPQAASSAEVLLKEEKMEKAENIVTIDQVTAVELRVGTIEECESVPKSDKLYKMQVNFGEFGRRQILAGIKKAFEPHELIGKQSVFVFNLAPRMMLGMESQGMLLVAKDEHEKPVLMQPSIKIANGSRLQ
jgi:methionyl-tRNA synthetase